MSKLLPFRHWLQPTSSDRRRRFRRGRTLTVERLEQRSLLASVPIELELVTDDLSSPVVATHAGDESGRIFVAQQGGAVRIVQNGQVEANPFLDLGSSGLNRIVSGGERGLLGLAFHPDFETPGSFGEGKFYLYYSAPATFDGDHDSVISEFQVSANPNLADPNSERILLRFNQPFSNHNGGDLHFGPDDGQLYVSSGDGGSGGDPQNNAQNLSSLLGKILRIDVDGNNSSNGQYGIPDSNPFVGQLGAREEIFAYGFRNPFRFSFDDGPTGAASTDRLFAGDVGQSAWEEIDLVTSGGNYGWRIREGQHPFRPNDPNPGNLIDPIAEYPNDQTTDAVIGGFVYRGTRFPQLQGQYLFADLSGKMFGLEQTGDSFSLFELAVQDGNPIGQNILAMGQDEAGELYVLTPTSLLAIEAFIPAWQNPVNRLDVNNDTLVSPVADVLPMINELNRRRLIDSSGRLPEERPSPELYYDVNGDGFLTAAGDILLVINFLNQSAEPESAESLSDVEPTPGEVPISFAEDTLLLRTRHLLLALWAQWDKGVT